MKNPDAMKYPNIKEFVFGKLIDSDRWSDEECLENLKNVFLESPRGRKLIDDLISETIDELDEYAKQMSDFEQRKREQEEEKSFTSHQDVENEPESEIDQLIRKSAEREQDYSELTKRELQDLIDDALDAGDFDKVRMLAQYLGESAHIYLTELERINESHKYHGRIN